MSLDLPNLRGTKFTIDLETRDPLLKTHGPSHLFGEGYVTGYAVGNADWQRYLPVRHGDDPDDAANGNLSGEDQQEVRRWLQWHLKDADTPKIAHNLQYDMGWLLSEEFELSKGNWHDTMVMAPLLDEYFYSFSLAALSGEHLAIEKKGNLLKQHVIDMFGKAAGRNAGSHMWRLPADKVNEYACGDIETTIGLADHFIPQIKEQNLQKVYEMEMKLLPVLIKMRRRGVEIDRPLAQKTLERYEDKLEETDKKLLKQTGEMIEPWAAAQIGPILESRGVECPRTPKTGAYSVTKEVLEESGDEFAQNVLDLRQYDRMGNVFIRNFLLHYSEKTGRIHAQFNQLRGGDDAATRGTVSGRFSSSDPNLQQIPARNPEFVIIRDMFIASNNRRWLAADYSSQEPRWTLHYAAKLGCRGAAAHVDMFIADPHTDYHGMTGDIVNVKRKQAKAINLGIVYGKGGGSLCVELGLPTIMKSFRKGTQVIEYLAAGEEGEALLDRYHAAIPYLKEFSKMVTSVARRRGYITTAGGRRCRFDDMAVTKKGAKDFRRETRKAVNRLIQGSSADQMKQAMIDCDAAGHDIIITVHDEIGFAYDHQDDLDSIQHLMENAIPCDVPQVADMDTGTSWGDTAK